MSRALGSRVKVMIEEESCQPGRLRVLGEDAGAEQEFEAALQSTLEDLGLHVTTFAESGVMTHNRGLVVKNEGEDGGAAEDYPRGKFQLTIVRDRRG